MSLSAIKANSALAAQSVAVSFVVDGSGSMFGDIESVKKGFDDFVKTHAGQNGEMKLSVAKFDDRYEQIFSDLDVHSLGGAAEKTKAVVSNARFKGELAKPAQTTRSSNSVCQLDRGGYVIDTVSKAQNCFKDNYGARGGTAIRDALKKAITDIEEQIKTGKRDSKERVVVALITDGADTHSRTTFEEINALVQSKRKLGWDFFFLGTQDANAVGIAEKMGIPEIQAATYAKVEDGVKLLSDKVSEARKKGNDKPLAITSTERLALAAGSYKKEL